MYKILKKERIAPQIYLIDMLDEHFAKSRQFLTVISKKNSEWENVYCKSFAVPTAMVPIIQSYVKQSYNDQTIEKTEKTSRGYEIDLSNDQNLIFGSKDNFIRLYH